MDASTDRQQRLGKAVRALREAQRLSQGELAAKTGVDLKTIQRIEGAKMPPNTRIVWSLSDVFGVSAAVVLGESPIPLHDNDERLARIEEVSLENSRSIDALLEVLEGAQALGGPVRERLAALRMQVPGGGAA
jgi:transcriptional regulator with XRE-family HTH domain